MKFKRNRNNTEDENNSDDSRQESNVEEDDDAEKQHHLQEKQYRERPGSDKESFENEDGLNNNERSNFDYVDALKVEKQKRILVTALARWFASALTKREILLDVRR